MGNDASNELDRRLLFEVTGLELLKDEFYGEDSSDSDSELPPDRPDSASPRVAQLMINPDTDSGGESEDSENQVFSTL